MPYAQDFAGLYIIRNEHTGNGYVGQSVRMRKRVAEHFRLLRRGAHPNEHLQRAFYKYGEENFSYDFEVICEDADELNMLEGVYLSGEAKFDDTPIYYNICVTPVEVMRGRKHTVETKRKISNSKKGCVKHVTVEYRKKLSTARQNNLLANPDFVAKVRFIVNNPDMSYAERGRVVGTDTSTARKLALRYKHFRGKI